MVKEKTTATEVKTSADAGELYLLTALSQKEDTLKTLVKIVSAKGKVEREESLGNKTLAYPINKHKELTLLSVFFSANTEDVIEIEKDIKAEDVVERFLITTWSAELPKEARSKKDES